jgi:predicted NBD/HSP70 family sugar kinase
MKEVMTAGTTSAGHLLELIRSEGGMSRQQLVAETGMSRGTLYGRLDALDRLGFVYEAESLGATGGRRARRIRFDDRGRVVLAVDLGQTHARISITDLIGTELRRATLPLDVAGGAPHTVLGPVLDHATRLAAKGEGERLVGVGVGVPAGVDPATGHVLQHMTLPGWPPDAVVAALGARWPVPSVVENDARAAAVGEVRSDEETLVYVKIATGLGCGIVVDGDVLRGARGIAGDIGHVRAAVPDNRGADRGASTPVPTCRCGRVGCLAAYSSGRALLERLAPRHDSLASIARAAAAGDPAVLAELAAAADVLGGALATTVTTVNPHRLVLGGSLGVLPVIVDGVRARVRDTVDERAWPQVEGSAMGDRATVRGLARLVVRRAFAPAAVDAAAARS